VECEKRLFVVWKQMHAGGRPVGEKSGSRDFGPAPQGSREGRTGKLPDGTPVIVRNGRGKLMGTLLNLLILRNC
jgi:hypothetical protein